jgi:hypothetical protein
LGSAEAIKNFNYGEKVKQEAMHLTLAKKKLKQRSL